MALQADDSEHTLSDHDSMTSHTLVLGPGLSR